MSNYIFSGIPTQPLQTLTFAAAQTWNVISTATAQVTLTGNMTSLNITNPVAGAVYVLTLIQDATGGRAVTLGATFKLLGGILPTLSSAANSRDILTCYFDGTNYNTVVNNDFK